MILLNANVEQPCSFWNFTITTSVFLWKNYTRKQCPGLVEKGHLHDFPILFFCAILPLKEDANMKPDIEKLRKKYMDNPPEGMTSEDIRRMSEDNLLDMDYFLNEDDI